jgi:hypothetical protein
MAMIEEETYIIKPRRLINIMNLLTDGPMPINSFIPHKETIEAKKAGVNLGFIEIRPEQNAVQLTSEGYSWLLRNGKIL